MSYNQFVIVFTSVIFLSLPSFSAEKEKIVPTSDIPTQRLFKLNENINPCDDFHAYVCSDAESRYKLRDDRSSHTFSFGDSSERILEHKKNFFIKIDSEKKLSARSQQLKSYYKACMNEATSAQEERELVNELKQTVDSMKNIQDYLNVNKKNMIQYYWSFIQFGINPNIDNPLIYDVTFGLDFMFLPEHSYYDNKVLVKDYVELITDFFVTIYPDQKKTDLAKRAKAVVDFEKKFTKSYPKPDEFRQRWTQPRYVSREEFFTQTSVIELKDFFKKNIPEKVLIRNFIPESFEFVQKELSDKNLQVLKDIYIFRNARTFMDDAYPDLYKKRLDFSHKHLGGSPVRPVRQERCTMSVMSAYGKELDQVLIDRLFKNFPEKKMQAVAAKIRQSILDGIEKNTWLSAESKKGALEKIKTAKLQIIQPRTEKEWDFKPILKLSSTHPYANDKVISVANNQRTFKKLKEGVNPEIWWMSPLTVNAYYSATSNKFVMPIGILQYPFFVADGDIIENLGAVGAVVGHELGHGIDDQGSKFNAQGQLKPWMSEEDVKQFKARGEKMIAQFDKIGHNGKLTLGENVADLVGLTFAYQAAFPEKVKKTSNRIADEKKFFVAYARLWCGIKREKAIEMQLKTGPHSLGYARINEQVKHQPGFQEAFSCKKGNKLFLEPKDQIQIW